MIEHTMTYYSCEYCGCEGIKSTIERHESYCPSNPLVKARFQTYVGRCFTNGRYFYRLAGLSEEGMKVISVFFDEPRETFIMRAEIRSLEDIEAFEEDYEEISIMDYLSILDKMFRKVRKW